MRVDTPERSDRTDRKILDILSGGLHELEFRVHVDEWRKIKLSRYLNIQAEVALKNLLRSDLYRMLKS